MCAAGDRRGDRLRDAVQLAVLGSSPAATARRSLRRHRRRILQRLPRGDRSVHRTLRALRVAVAAPGVARARRSRATRARRRRPRDSSPVDVSLVGEAATTSACDVPVSIPTGYVPLPDRATSSARCSRTVRRLLDELLLRLDASSSSRLLDVLGSDAVAVGVHGDLSLRDVLVDRRGGTSRARSAPVERPTRYTPNRSPSRFRFGCVCERLCFSRGGLERAFGIDRAPMHAANALKYAACLGVVATSACVDLARVAVETARGPARFRRA